MMIEAALGVSLGHTEAAALANRFMLMVSGGDRKEQKLGRKSPPAKRGKAASAKTKGR
jgi:hypothetical protein